MWLLSHLWSKILFCQPFNYYSNKNVYYNSVKTNRGEIIFDIELQISNGGDSYTRDIFPYSNAQINEPVVLTPPSKQCFQSFSLHVKVGFRNIKRD